MVVFRPCVFWRSPAIVSGTVLLKAPRGHQVPKTVETYEQKGLREAVACVETWDIHIFDAFPRRC